MVLFKQILALTLAFLLLFFSDSSYALACACIDCRKAEEKKHCEVHVLRMDFDEKICQRNPAMADYVVLFQCLGIRALCSCFNCAVLL